MLKMVSVLYKCIGHIIILRGGGMIVSPSGQAIVKGRKGIGVWCSNKVRLAPQNSDKVENP